MSTKQNKAKRARRRLSQWEEQISAIPEVDEETLPQDPEECGGPSNYDRATFAEEALRAFNAETGTDVETAICDLVGDLGHWCDRHRMNMAEEYDRGMQMYLDETDGKGTAFEPDPAQRSKIGGWYRPCTADLMAVLAAAKELRGALSGCGAEVTISAFNGLSLAIDRCEGKEVSHGQAA